MTQALTGPMAPPKSGGAPRSIVVLLHGYGSNGADLVGLTPYWRDALPDTLFAAPNAPQPCPGVYNGYQWWPLTDFSPQARAAGVRLAAPAVHAYLDGLMAQHVVGPDKVALVGFSQGTMMALHVGPRREEPIAGIVGYSGMLADPEALRAELRTRPPMLLVHGDMDDVLPVSALGQAREVLTDLGFEVATHVSRGIGHSVDEDGLRLGREFLVGRLG